MGFRQISRSDWYKEINSSGNIIDRVISRLRKLNIPVVPYRVDIDNFLEWVQRFGGILPSISCEQLPRDIAAIRDELRTEKLFEYFVSCDLMPQQKKGIRVADVGSANSPFIKFMVENFDCLGWMIDPSLEFQPPEEHPKITPIPLTTSLAKDLLPEMDMICLHCSFEMFNPQEMIAVIELAESKLAEGGKIIVVPLYLSPKGTIYIDSNIRDRDLKSALIGSADLVKVDDYWCLDWSEWLSPDDLDKRLAKNFSRLDFHVYHVENLHDINKSIFAHFIGVWTKNTIYSKDC